MYQNHLQGHLLLQLRARAYPASKDNMSIATDTQVIVTCQTTISSHCSRPPKDGGMERPVVLVHRVGQQGHQHSRMAADNPEFQRTARPPPPTGPPKWGLAMIRHLQAKL